MLKYTVILSFSLCAGQRVIRGITFEFERFASNLALSCVLYFAKVVLRRAKRDKGFLRNREYLLDGLRMKYLCKLKFFCSDKINTHTCFDEELNFFLRFQENAYVSYLEKNMR